jgi:O-antigen ligase
VTWLLGLFYFLRPIMFVDVGWDVAGLNLAEMFAVAGTGLVILLFMARVVLTKRLRFSAVDMCIVLFVFWCVFVYVLYLDRSRLEDLAKFTWPFVTYLAMKNLIKDDAQWYKLLRFLLVGFAIPAGLSAFLIMQGKGLDQVIYWTGLHRFQGVYVNPHNLGHSMAFALMAVTIGYAWRRDIGFKAKRTATLWRVFIMVLVLLCLYCLYKSYVRTAMVGFAGFGFFFLVQHNRKLLLAMLAGLVLLVGSYMAVVSTIFFDVVETIEGERDVERIASGRPFIWKHNLSEFGRMGLDRQLAGVGVGNRRGIFVETAVSEDIWNSHNDFLEVLIQTGIVGFVLYMLMQLFLLRAIWRVDGALGRALLAMFLAVAMMNFVSNSYVVRFGIAQMYYMVLAVAEIPARRKREAGAGAAEDGEYAGQAALV